jgi:hypothetical protein
MNRHAKVIQQRKIAHLEARLARLEREAGLMSVIKGLGDLVKKAINVPVNFIKNLAMAMKDISNSFKAETDKILAEKVNKVGMLLGTRIWRALVGPSGISTSSIPQIVSFNSKKPIDSIFTGGLAGDRKMPLSKLVTLYSSEEQKRIKGAFLSWHEDWKYVVHPEKFSPSKFKELLNKIKRWSKLLYRVFSVVAAMLAVQNILFFPSINALWQRFWMIFAVGEGMQPIIKGAIEAGKMGAEITFKDPGLLAELREFSLEGVAVTTVLTLIERAFYKWGVNEEEFNQMAKGKTATLGRNPRAKFFVNHFEATYA